MLSKSEFLKPAERRYALVQLTDGRWARIRSLNEFEQSAYESATLVKTKRGLETDLTKAREQPRRLIVLCLCAVFDTKPDAQEAVVAGGPLLTEQDLPGLGALDGGLVADLYDQCRRHCGFEKRAEQLEETEKNSNTAGGGE